MSDKIKAVGLLSGGLDSILAVKLMIDQGIEVHAVNFTSPFFNSDSGRNCYAVEVAKKFGIPLKMIVVGPEYFRIIRNPKHGHGSGMNPCIDCKIYFLKIAKKYADEIGAKFIFTGEVFGQRPMSQRLEAMKIIEKEAGLDGKVLRPLSSKFLKKTEAEREGWVDREKLMGIKGRSRKPQMELARQLHIADYPSPGGGCLLTYKEFARKVSDLFVHKKRVVTRDMNMLKAGKHFRYGANKIVVGANEEENNRLLALKYKTDYIFEVPGVGSPVTVLTGEKTRDAIRMAARLTARYSDADSSKVLVRYGTKRAVKGIWVAALDQKRIEKLRV
ncbi:MAG: hypothetical protein ABIG84_00165 [archaeon]